MTREKELECWLSAAAMGLTTAGIALGDRDPWLANEMNTLADKIIAVLSARGEEHIQLSRSSDAKLCQR